jgi:multiple sugar transport system substrate-binding protein
MRRVQLRAIAWNHSRALPPLVATAQRFEELHPGVEIAWEKRSLHAFGHSSLPELTQMFDLLVVDHPMMGDAEASGSLLDLSSLLRGEEYEDLEHDSAGASFSSYVYKSKLYALPIDAAAPAASFRPDMLATSGLQEPEQWSELLELARLGLVRMPGFPADLFLNFMAMCVSRGSPAFDGSEKFPESLIDRPIALRCLEELRELASLMPSEIYRWNPITLYEQMSSSDSFAYCPFAYTYSNYSRAGFAAKHVRFVLSPRLADGVRMRTVLGGTGLAISKYCVETSVALEYSLYVAGRTCQSTMYGVYGGQPARRSAWKDEELNRLTDGFFQRTLGSIEAACMRPRYPGYVALQEKAGLPIAEYLKEGGSAVHTIDRIDALYRANLATIATR